MTMASTAREMVGKVPGPGRIGEALATSASTANSLRCVLERVASRLRGEQPSEVETGAVAGNISEQMHSTNVDLSAALVLAEEIEALL